MPSCGCAKSSFGRFRQSNRGHIVRWGIRARMKPALAVTDLIPTIHRRPALAALLRAVPEGRPVVL